MRKKNSGQPDGAVQIAFFHVAGRSKRSQEWNGSRTIETVSDHAKEDAEKQLVSTCCRRSILDRSPRSGHANCTHKTFVVAKRELTGNYA